MMDPFGQAAELYRQGRLLIEWTRDLAVEWDELRWAREDLEDILLDLKQATIRMDSSLAEHHLNEATALIAEIYQLISESD